VGVEEATTKGENYN